MYLRATRTHVPPENIKEAIHTFETLILPSLRATPGNQGAVLLVNRVTGEGLGVTYWDSARALGASEQVGVDSRTQSASRIPGLQVINVERSEIMVMDRVAPPEVGRFVRLTSATGEIDKLDAGVNFFRTKVVPVLHTLKGYRAGIASVDRQTGRSFTSSVWDTKADLEASETAIAPLRSEAAKTAGFIPETVRVEVFETAVAELSSVAAAQTARV